ncbi:MAG TPA: EamA family transporter, partial [Longimicrobium sp.]|nr:EamA family transporter [Longimicrobium sp.]
MVTPSPPTPARLKADAVLLGLTAVWGLTFAVVKGALDQADPFAFLALRFTLGAAAATLIAGRRLLHVPSVRAGLVLAPFLFCGFALQTMGLRYTTASRSAFFTGLCVVLVPFVQVALY